MKCVYLELREDACWYSFDRFALGIDLFSAYNEIVIFFFSRSLGQASLEFVGCDYRKHTVYM